MSPDDVSARNITPADAPALPDAPEEQQKLARDAGGPSARIAGQEEPGEPPKPSTSQS